MAKGRAEVLGLVARRKYGELMERDLGGRRLQRSMLDIRCGLTCCGATMSQQPVTLAMPVQCRCATWTSGCKNAWLDAHVQLNCRFHVRDLIGHGELQRVHTTSGPLLRTVKRN